MTSEYRRYQKKNSAGFELSVNNLLDNKDKTIILSDYLIERTTFVAESIHVLRKL
jgi:hypothetical protein